jgi:plastocyanin
MRAAALVALIGASSIFVACGSSSSDKTATSQPAASSPARATAPAAAATAPAGGATSAGGSTLNVSARDFLFDPNKLSAKPGTSVTINFKNDGSTAHTFSLYTDEDHTKAVANGDSGTVSAGGSKTLTITIASDSGDLYYRCEIHPTQMMGEISVD